MCALTTGGHLLNGSSTARLRSGPGISHDRTRSRSAVCIGLDFLTEVTMTGSGLDILQDTCDFLDQDWIWIFVFKKNWIRT